MAAQNSASQTFGYTWGFADNSRGESVVEISPNINYTMPYLQLSDGSNIIIQKDSKGTITHTNKGAVRRILLANDTSMIQGSTQRVITTSGATNVSHHKKHDVLSMGCDKNCNCSEGTTQITPIFTTSNGLIDAKGQTVLTASNNKTTTHFMSPIGPLQLTAEECNEILMKRAAAAVAASNQQQQHTISSDGHHSISVQVQKVIQGLEDDNDSQTTTTHLKIEPNLEISPKIEQIEFFEQEVQSDSQQNGNTQIPAKERPYACDQCGKSFLLKHHLTTHARVHTGERPHVCSHCGKDFAHKHCLNTHLLLHSTERPYQCTECKKSFTLKHHLLTHTRVHSRDRPFVCAECGRSFPLKRHLVTHSKFHAGERPFVCEDCGESFAQKDHLVMHSRFHGSVNPFVCNECGSTFPRKFQLVNHQKLHGKVPHSCSVCGKEFLQKRTLQAHMRMHTGDQPFPCIACGEGFRTKSELNQHNRVTHGGVTTSPNTTIVPVSITSVSQQQNHHQQQQQQQPQQQHTTQVQHQSQVHTVQVQTQTQQLQQTQQVHQNQQTVEIQTVQHHQPTQQTVTVVSGNPNIITTLASPQQQEQSVTHSPRYGCRECGSAFNSKEALALHLRLHTGDKSLMTDLCALTAAIPGHLFQGTTTVNAVPTSPVPVQLISSNGQVISQATLAQSSPVHQQQTIQQIQTHPQTQQIKYEQQMIQMVQQPQQQQQQQQQQTQQQQPQQQQQNTTVVTHIQPTQQKPKTHFCGHCGKGFAAKHGLLLHNKRHPNGGCTMRNHICECGKAFFQKNHLMLHQRQHMEQKPNIVQLQHQSGQNEVIVTQAQQVHQQNPPQNQLTRNLVISQQPMHLQVLQDNTAQVIKYEIIQPESRNSIE